MSFDPRHRSHPCMLLCGVERDLGWCVTSIVVIHNDADFRLLDMSRRYMDVANGRDIHGARDHPL